MRKSLTPFVRRLLLLCLVAGSMGFRSGPIAFGQVSYTSAYLTDLNYNTQYPCGDPTQTTPTGQIATNFNQLKFYGGGAEDWTCYQKAFEIDADIFSPISANILIWGGEHAITVNADATIPSNMMICFGPGGSIAAGGGFTLINNSTPCFGGGGGGSCPGSASPTQILYDLGGACAGIPTSEVDVPDTRVSWQYFFSFGIPVASMDPYFSNSFVWQPHEFQFVPDNFVTDASNVGETTTGMAIFAQGDSANGLWIKTLATGDETLTVGEQILTEMSGNGASWGMEIASDYTGANTEASVTALQLYTSNSTSAPFGANTGLAINDITGGSANSAIQGGLGLYTFGDWTSFGIDTFANLQAQVISIPLTEGYQKLCSDCDTPAFDGALCTASADNAGALATFIQGNLYCSGRSAAAGGGNFVLNNQTNVYSTGIQNMSAATDFYAPAGAGAVGSHASDFRFDTTFLNYHGFAGGEDVIFAVLPAGLNPSDGNCANFSVVAGFISLGTTGLNCGSGGGGSGTVTNFDAVNIPGFATKSVATSTTTPVLTYALTTVANNEFWGGPCTGGPLTPGYRVLCSGDIPSTIAATTTGDAGGITGFTNPTPAGAAVLRQTVFTGTKALSVSALNNDGSCNVDTLSAAGTVVGDVVDATPTEDLTGVSGYAPTGPILTFYPPQVLVNGTITIKVCNNAQNPAPITPGTVHLNLVVSR